MLINHEYKYIFLHIPKSGGTFARSVLDNIPGTTEPRGDPHFGLHLLNGDYNDYKKIVIVRNPINWYISLFEHIKRGGADKVYVQEWIAFKNNGFLGWLKNILNLNANKSCFSNPRITGNWSTAHAIRFLENNTFNIGWWSYILVYQTMTNWQKFLKEKEISEFKNYTEADFILKTDTINKDLYNTMIELNIPENLANKALITDKKNIGNYSKDKYINTISDDLIAEIKNRESLIYSLLNV